MTQADHDGGRGNEKKTLDVEDKPMGAHYSYVSADRWDSYKIAGRLPPVPIGKFRPEALTSGGDEASRGFAAARGLIAGL